MKEGTHKNQESVVLTFLILPDVIMRFKGYKMYRSNSKAQQVMKTINVSTAIPILINCNSKLNRAVI